MVRGGGGEQPKSRSNRSKKSDTFSFCQFHMKNKRKREESKEDPEKKKENKSKKKIPHTTRANDVVVKEIFIDSSHQGHFLVVLPRFQGGSDLLCFPYPLFMNREKENINSPSWPRVSRQCHFNSFPIPHPSFSSIYHGYPSPFSK